MYVVYRNKYFSFYVASQRKNDCQSNFRVFSTVFLRYTKNLVEIILARFSVELLNNGFDRKTRYLHVFWNFGKGFTKERENSSVWALLLQNCSFFLIFLHLRTMTNLSQRTLITVVLGFHFYFLKQLYFIIFVCLILIFRMLKSRSILVIVSTFIQFLGNVPRMLIFSAMNLLKQATLLYFENPWSELNFFSVWL